MAFQKSSLAIILLLSIFSESTKAESANDQSSNQQKESDLDTITQTIQGTCLEKYKDTILTMTKEDQAKVIDYYLENQTNEVEEPENKPRKANKCIDPAILTKYKELERKRKNRNRKNSRRVEWFYLGSQHSLKPSNNFTNPRPQSEFKQDKISHLISKAEAHDPTALDEDKRQVSPYHNRETDIKRLEEFFTPREEYRKFDSIVLSASNVLPKEEIMQKLRDFFSSGQSDESLLFLSGVCSDRTEFIYEGHQFEEIIRISYEDILNAWKSKNSRLYHKQLLIILDCPFSGLWVNRCKSDFDYQYFSIQASSKDDETALDIQDHGSLFLNNLLHDQFIRNDPDYTSWLYNETFKSDYQQWLQTMRNTSKLVHTYKHTPTSCGFYFKNLESFDLSTMYDSWDEIIRADLIYTTQNLTNNNGVYKGEVRSEKPNGRGTVEFEKTKEKYEGEFKFGERRGRGIFHFNDSSYFEGDWKSDRKIRGVFHLSNGDKYTGPFKKDVMHGNGTYYDRQKNETYVGNFNQGVKEGYGVNYLSNEAQYRGEYKNDEYDGIGEVWHNNAVVSRSQYKNGKRNGEGWMILKEGHNFTGNFTDNIAVGKGRMVFRGGDVYEGDFVNGKGNGKGKFIFTNGNIYEGDIVNGKRHGKGVLYIHNGDRYEGDFQEDKITGVGALYYNRGIYKGDFVDGKFHGRGTMHLNIGGRYEGEFRDGKIFRDESDL